MKENEIFKLKQELSEVKDLVQEILRRFGEVKTLLHKVIEKQEKIELSGEITYGEPHHIGRKEKQVNISLRRPLKQS